MFKAMRKLRSLLLILAFGAVVLAAGAQTAPALKYLYNPGRLKPVDSRLKVKVGDVAPDFALRSATNNIVSLKQFRGKKNVVISFVPAAYTPICSAQWPGYHLAKDIFDKHDTVLLGIATDNIPTLYAWTEEMGGMWFEVLSDFYPHGKVASAYGVLRSDGTAERALFLIDKRGVLRYLDVHDINERPPLEDLAAQLDKWAK